MNNLLCDNGKEFKNKKFIKYCKINNITLLHGRPLHPQTQGVVERYNRTIKELLKNIYIENNLNDLTFNLKKEIEKAINTYNTTKHNTTGFTPLYVFNHDNEALLKKVKYNTFKK